jgi:hypothetical protein
MEGKYSYTTALYNFCTTPNIWDETHVNGIRGQGRSQKFLWAEASDKKKKKKKIVGVSRLNFYFLPYIFLFFRKKKFTPYNFFFKKLVREGGHGLRAPSLRSWVEPIHMGPTSCILCYTQIMQHICVPINS